MKKLIVFSAIFFSGLLIFLGKPSLVSAQCTEEYPIEVCQFSRPPGYECITSGRCGDPISGTTRWCCKESVAPACTEEYPIEFCQANQPPSNNYECITSGRCGDPISGLARWCCKYFSASCTNPDFPIESCGFALPADEYTCIKNGECGVFPATRPLYCCVRGDVPTPTPTPIATATPTPTPTGELADVTCTSSGGGEGIKTAIGCIPFENANALIGFLLRWGIGIGGGIAFLLILFAGFLIMTSTGDPKRVQAGKELLTAAIAGLILLIFSVFILEFIGIDILGIPGFGG